MMTAASMPAHATLNRPFETPNGKDVCQTTIGHGFPNSLECGAVNAELTPPPPRPTAAACGGLDFATNRLALGPTGRPYGFCAGDPGVLAELKEAYVLPYGDSTTQGPFRCSSTQNGLECRNRSGHGFLIDGRRWHPF
jgi:hypothetical protein